MTRLHLRRAATIAASMSLCLGIAVIGLETSSASAAGVPGVTAHSITIGATVPLTGIASPGYNEVAKGARAVFDYVNKHGGVNGRSIRYVLEDDCYDTSGYGCTGVANTVTQTQKLLALPVFATVGSLGTPTQDTVRNLLKANGVPQLFVNSGSSDWNNPRNYPELFGWQPSYVVESKIMAKYIERTWPGQKVCFIGQNDDFGKNGLAGLKYAGVNPAIQQLYSVGGLVAGGGGYFTPFISAEQSAHCKVVYLDTIPGATEAALGNAEALGFTPHWVISSVGSDPVTIKEGLGANDDETGAITFGYLPASTQATSWHAWMYKVIEGDPSDFPGFTSKTPLNGNEEYGIGFGVSFVEALKAAGPNFTRASFVHTLLTTSFETPVVVPLKYSNANHQGFLGGFIAKVKSATQTEVVNPYKVYLTTATKLGPVVQTHSLSSGIPSWLLH